MGVPCNHTELPMLQTWPWGQNSHWLVVILAANSAIRYSKRHVGRMEKQEQVGTHLSKPACPKWPQLGV